MVVWSTVSIAVLVLVRYAVLIAVVANQPCTRIFSHNSSSAVMDTCSSYAKIIKWFVTDRRSPLAGPSRTSLLQHCTGDPRGHCLGSGPSHTSCAGHGPQHNASTSWSKEMVKKTHKDTQPTCSCTRRGSSHPPIPSNRGVACQSNWLVSFYRAHLQNIPFQRILKKGSK